MGANIWFWLIYVIVGIFGLMGISPWGGTVLAHVTVGGWLVLFICGIRCTINRLSC
jgi:hypothetical protein